MALGLAIALSKSMYTCMCLMTICTIDVFQTSLISVNIHFNLPDIQFFSLPDKKKNHCRKLDILCCKSQSNTCKQPKMNVFIYLFGVSHRFQQCTGHITTGSWESRGNQYIQLVKVLYCKLPTNSKQLPAFPLEVVTGTEHQS